MNKHYAATGGQLTPVERQAIMNSLGHQVVPDSKPSAVESNPAGGKKMNNSDLADLLASGMKEQLPTPHYCWPRASQFYKNAQWLVDRAIRHGDISVSRGAEILGITLREMRELSKQHLPPLINPTASVEPSGTVAMSAGPYGDLSKTDAEQARPLINPDASIEP